MRNRSAYAQFNQCCNLQGKINSGILAGYHSSTGKEREGEKILLDSCVSQLHSKKFLPGIFAAIG